MQGSSLLLNPAEPINWANRLNDGLVSRWKCTPYAIHNRGIGWRDLVRRFGGGIATNLTWTGPKSRLGGYGASSFNASNSYVTVSNFLLGGTSLTAAGWVNTPNWAPAMMVICKEVVNSGWDIRSESGVLNLRGSGGPNLTVAFPSVDVWHHIAVTISGTSGVIYIDGVPVASGAVSAITDATDTLSLGRYAGFGGGYYFNGFLDDWSVYNRELSATELAQFYDNTSRLDDPTLNWMRRVAYSLPVATGIAFDAASNSGYQAASATPTPWNHTWSGANRGIGVDVAILSVPGTTVTSVTFNGVALSLVIGRSTVTAFGRNESWAASAAQLGGLAAGTYQIAVTLSAAAVSASTAVSYTGVHQTVPTEGANSAQATNTGVGTDASVALTSIADNCWPHAAIATDDGAVTANQTGRNNVTGLLGSGANEDTNAAVTPAGATTMSYSGMGIAATWAMTGYVWRPVAASGGTTLQNLTGTLTTVGALVKMGLQAKTGSVSFSGSRVNQAQQAKTGSVACSGSLTKSALIALVGALTLTGATITKIVGKAITGVITLSGSLARAITQALAGAITLTGSLAKLSAKLLTGAVTLAGAISNLVAKALTESITLSGVLSAFRIVVQSLTGSITLTGATVTKLVSKSITTTITLGGTIAKSFLKQLAGAIGLSGLFSYLIPERVSPPVTIDALNFQFTIVDAAEFGYSSTDAIDFNFTTYDAVDFE